MTGTAATEITEFESIYKLKVTIVPTNKPMIRKDEFDLVFRATTGKWRAVVAEISRMNITSRGTDIILGGNVEFMARLKLREILMPRYGGALIGIHFHPFLLFPQAYNNRLAGFWTSIGVVQQYSTVIHVNKYFKYLTH
ncbi:protein translocase subunit SecA, chloroplastic-like [Vicia villosa]|uniref:protein translocase subunit SecA, chloroplastic-like n=1 Tax=Vicia villosa TaxID=3911 RepID=UPI00273CE68C|nr:protein translocase subunit SecA, chloroplastic-like [Vicia villosa]